MELLPISLHAALPWRSAHAMILAVGLFASSGNTVSGSEAAKNTTPVDLALILAVDSSSSVDGPEYDLQIHGYANAFRDDEVIDAIERLDGTGIAVTFVQWSANFQQFQTVPWLQVVDRASAEAFATAIETQSRKFVGFGTALGSAIEYSVGLFPKSRYRGRRKSIDISADERANMGAHPSYTREMATAAGITINGLAILHDHPNLSDYFHANVITGPDAFVQTVASYDDIANAIKRKLLREIAGNSVSYYPGHRMWLAKRQ